MTAANVIGVILAGGQSRRMGGRAKALLACGGETMIRRQLRLMESLCAEWIVVTNEPEQLRPHLNRPVTLVPDRYAGKGPLAGIHAALRVVDGERAAWIVGCDMPFVSASAATAMLSLLERQGPTADAVVPVVGGKWQPLHGLYRPRCARPAAALLDAQSYRLFDWLRELRTIDAPESLFAGLGIDPRFAYNANTPDEWEEAERLAREQP